jgi:tetratricopeptide (TPR) repeat protein
LERANAGPREEVLAIRLRGTGFQLEKKYSAARKAYQQSLDLLRAINPEGEDVAMAWSDLADVESLSLDYAAAERYYREALRVATKIGAREGSLFTGATCPRSHWGAAIGQPPNSWRARRSGSPRTWVEGS